MVYSFFEQEEDHSHLKMVDPDKFPVDIDRACEKAQEYALSLTGRKLKMFSKPQMNGEKVTEIKRLNNYSGKYLREESMSIWSEDAELFFLGQGYPMYFDFVKSSMIILFLIFVSSGAYNIFSNAFVGEDCKDNATIKEMVAKGHNVADICQLSWTTLLSLANKRSDQNLILLQDIMNLLTVITIVLVLQYLRTNQRVLNEFCDELLISPSDYTVWISGIPDYPENAVIDQEIKQEIEQQVKEHYCKESPENIPKFEVINVTVCYNLAKINDLITRRSEIIEKVRKIKMGNLPSFEDKTEIEFMTELQDIKDSIAAKQQEYYDGNKGENNIDFCGHAFVTMSTEFAKSALIEAQDVGILSCCSKNKQISINGATVDVIAAPEPTDVNWNHLVIKPSEQFFRNIASSISTVLLLGVSFVIIMALMWVQSSGQEKKIIMGPNGKQQVILPEMTLKIKAIALLISIVIPALNFILQIFLTKLSIFERHHRKTREIASLGVKLAIAQFINTAVITFIIKVMFDFFDDPQKAEDNIFMNGGLIFNQQYVFITNSLFAAASLITDGGRLFKIINRTFLAKKQFMTQRQLNSLYEEPEHNLAFEYSGLMKTILFTAFYAPLIPVGIILSMAGISLLYIIQKYKISNHRTIRYSMSNLISLEMIELMEFILPIYCISNMIYEYILVPGSTISWFSLLGICIGIINIFLPMETINKALFKVRLCPPLKETYNDNISNFQFDYDRANPATDDFARSKYIDQEKHRLHQSA